MKTLTNLILISFVVSLNAAIGQSPLQDPTNAILPPSPTAASFAAYQNIPVSLNNGKTKINVPITEVSQGQIKVPISLSYHNDLKVDQVSSWVGLGWSLNAGGVISRTVRGIHDEDPYGYMNVSAEIPYPFDLASDYDMMRSFAQQADGSPLFKDGQPDLFHFNMPGYGGKFVFKNKHVAQTVPMQEIRIDYTMGFSSIETITLTTPDGLLFIFGENGAHEKSSTFFNWIQGGGGDPEPEYEDIVTAWYLTKILDPIHKDSILFEYSSFEASYDLAYSESLDFPLSITPSECQSAVQSGRRSYTITKTDQGVNLSRIVTESSQVRFNKFGLREDLFRQLSGSPVSNNRLSRILVQNQFGNTLKKYNLYQSFIESSGPTVAFNDQPSRKRMYLDSIQESNGPGTEFSPPHKFFYKNREALPPRLSKSQDHWGYFNGENNQNKDFTPSEGAWQTNQVNQYSFLNYQPANREINHAYSGIGLLEKWQYPTGGYTEFEFEGNTIGTCSSTDIEVAAMFERELSWSDVGQATTVTGIVHIDHSQFVDLSIRAVITDEDALIDRIEIERLNGSYNRTWGHGTEIGPIEIIDFANEWLYAGDYQITLHIENDAIDNLEVPFSYGEYSMLRLSYTTLEPEFQQNDAGPGVRISSIKTYEQANADPIVQLFQYEFDVNGCMRSSALSMGARPFYHQNKEIRTPGVIPCTTYDCFQGTMTSKTTFPLTTVSGAQLSYKRVREIHGVNLEGGFSDHYFQVTRDGSPEIGPTNHTDFLNTPRIDLSHANGQLLSKIDYNSNGQKVQEIINEWCFQDPVFRKKTKGIVARELFTDLCPPAVNVQCDGSPEDEYYLVNCDPFLGTWWIGGGPIADALNNNDCDTIFTQCYYLDPYETYVNHIALDNYSIEYFDVISQFVYLKNSKLRKYDAFGNYVEKNTTYTYDPEGKHLSPIQVTEQGIDGKKYITHKKYPMDFINKINWQATDNPVKGIEALLARNLNPVLEMTNLIKEDWVSEAKLVSSRLFEYHNQNGIGYKPLLKKVWDAELTYPKPVTTFNSLDISEVLFWMTKDVSYTSHGIAEAELFIDNYNSKGQIESLHFNHHNSKSILWADYSGNLIPIGQAENAKSSDVSYLPCEDYQVDTWTQLSTITSNGKAGKCMEVAGNGPQLSLIPSSEKQSDLYVFSGWVKGTGQVTFKVETRNLPTQTYVYEVESTTIQSNANWNYIEVKVDLTKIRETLQISSSVQLQLVCKVQSNLSSYFIDELKVHSVYSPIVTRTYNDNMLLIAMSDQNDKYQYYSYDSFQRLKLVRDFEGNILNKNEYHYGNIFGLNDIINTQFLVEEKDETQISSLNNLEKVVTKSYLDGLGREIQRVSVRQSPLERDVISHFDYDALGRVTKQYLPFTKQSNGGDYRFNAEFLQSLSFGNVQNAFAYSESVFDGSPLNRVIQSASPGSSWKIGSGHEVNLMVRGNYAGEVQMFNANGLSTSSYPAQMLIVNSVSDEDGNTVLKYSDLLGREIMSDNNGAKTYTVYDDFGRVKYVIPPVAFEAMQTSGIFNCNLSTVKDGTYSYIYDARGRVIRKDIPGKNMERIHYDRLDRPVLTVDANNNKHFTKFDILSRPIMNGVYHGSATPGSYYDLFETKSTQEHGYTNNSFPQGNYDVLSVNYYDDYDFDNDGTVGSNEEFIVPVDADYSSTFSNHVWGMSTGSKVAVLKTDGFTVDKYLNSRVFYDKKNRSIQSISENSTGAEDLTHSAYNFTGLLTSQKTLHRAILGNTTSSTILDEEFTYDHAGRLLKSYLTINGGDKELISDLEYNERNQLKRKKLGAIDNQESNFLQKIDYSYNIRGWLIGINSPGNCSSVIDFPGDLIESKSLSSGGSKSLNIPLTSTNDDIFSMNLFYQNQRNGLSISPQYNGNITAIEWQEGCDQTTKGYGFEYDNRNQITQALFSEKSAKGTSYQKTGTYNLNNVDYDLNGNILALNRNGLNGVDMDNLIYTIDENNQLSTLEEVGDLTTGFVSTQNTAGYIYDNAGNMIRDDHKGLNIHYNINNLPYIMAYDNQDSIRITYSAGGGKISKETKKYPDLIWTKKEYIGQFEYANNQLEAIYHEEGRIIPSGNNFQYEYTIKDHLGNTRATFSDLNGDGEIKASDDEVLQTAHYYPFGMKMEGASDVVYGTENAYQYNGKELNTEFELNWLDYGARWYDPSIARWNSVDPLAEKMNSWSSYNYVYNNPIRLLDPDGKAPKESQDPIIVSSEIATSYHERWVPDLDRNGNRTGGGSIVVREFVQITTRQYAGEGHYETYTNTTITEMTIGSNNVFASYAKRTTTGTSPDGPMSTGPQMIKLGLVSDELKEQAFESYAFRLGEGKGKSKAQLAAGEHNIKMKFGIDLILEGVPLLGTLVSAAASGDIIKEGSVQIPLGEPTKRIVGNCSDCDPQ